jgi:hypothetical protein
MPVINLRHVSVRLTNTAFEGESIVYCSTPLASLLAGLLGNLALRGRVAGVAIAAIVVRRAICIIIVVATVAAKVVMRYTRKSSRDRVHVLVTVVVAVISALADAVVIRISLRQRFVAGIWRVARHIPDHSSRWT